MQTAKKLLCTGALILSGTAGVHLFAQEEGSTIRACVGPAGAIRILPAGQACRTSETPLEWSAGSNEPTTPIPPPPPPPGPGSGLRVMNALGLEVGPLLGSSFAALTLPTGRRAYAELFPANAPANWVVTQYYQSSDCSTEPLVTWTTIEELMTPALVRRSGVWALRPGTLARRTMASRKVVDDRGPSVAACQSTAGTFDSWQFDFYTPDQVGLIYPLVVE